MEFNVRNEQFMSLSKGRLVFPVILQIHLAPQGAQGGSFACFWLRSLVGDAAGPLTPICFLATYFSVIRLAKEGASTLYIPSCQALAPPLYKIQTDQRYYIKTT